MFTTTNIGHILFMVHILNIYGTYSVCSPFHWRLGLGYRPQVFVIYRKQYPDSHSKIFARAHNTLEGTCRDF